MAISWTDALRGHFDDWRVDAMVRRDIAFYRAIIDAWNRGGRSAALHFLASNSDRMLRTQQVDGVDQTTDDAESGDDG